MIKSMTGYGKAVCELENKKVTVEIKSLNSKQFDLNVRLPRIYKEKELDVRSKMSKQVQRGKVDIAIFFESTDEEKNYSINASLVKNYYEGLKSLTKELGYEEKHSEPMDYLNVIMKFPDVLKSEEKEFDKNEWEHIDSTIDKALQELIQFRAEEGEVLELDLINRTETIQKLQKETEVFESKRIDIIKERIRKNLAEIIGGKEKIDENRFEQELIYYLEKLDITEEKVRLRSHCEYFLKTMAEPEVNGKKLGFITQEMGREINTIGSKANDADMQKIVVQMKDELEKIKEQLSNVL